MLAVLFASETTALSVEALPAALVLAAVVLSGPAVLLFGLAASHTGDIANYRAAVLLTIDMAMPEAASHGTQARERQALSGAGGGVVPDDRPCPVTR